jgi:predicted  nucleic acid-binding Zn-ribbon protein
MIHDVLTAVQRLGNPGEPLLQELQRIENSIVDAFRKDPEETFAHSSHYQEQIQRLEKKLNQFASRAEREFNQLQDTYREMFIRYANITNNNLWQRIFYSANNVEGVYTNLHEAIQGQTVTLLENLFQEIEQRRDDILSLLTVSDDGRSVSNDIVGDLQQQVDSLDDEYTHLTDQIDQSTIQDPQKLQNWLESFAKVFRQLTDLKAEIQNLREPSNEQLFSPDEQALLDVIAKRGASGSLVRARQELNNLDDEMFWQLLRELWERRIIEISVKNLD